MDIRLSNLKNKLFLDIPSTNIDTLVPSRYQCIETGSIEVFWLLSQALSHLRFIICRFRRSLREFLDSVVNLFKQQTLPTVNRKYLFTNIICIQPFHSQKLTTGHSSSVVWNSSTVAIVTTETILWTCTCTSATCTVMKMDSAAS
jgi:hypothetical protein